MENKTTFRILPVVEVPRISPALQLTAAYLILGISWILLSDSIAVKLADENSSAFEKIQAAKGVFFIFLSGIMLYLLSRKMYNNIIQYNLQKEDIEEKYLALSETAREGIFDYNIKDRNATINHKMKFFFPHKGKEVEDFWQVYQKRFHPADLARLCSEYIEIMKSSKQTWQTEIRLLGNDNKYYTVISNTYIIRDTYTNEPLRMIGTILDISDLRNLQAEHYEQKLKHKRTLAASIIKAQENERTRWAEELHDNVCQLLSVANMYAGNICNKKGDASPEAPEIKKLITESINEIRQLSASIRTPVFAKESLTDAIDKLVSNINRVNTIEFNLCTDSFDESRIGDEQQLMIYRVIQEQMNNIIKYAEASRVTINLSMKADTVYISVQDNGKGFDPGKVKSGIGLQNIESRLHIYGGRLDIKSSPGKGCTLLASFKMMAA